MAGSGFNIGLDGSRIKPLTEKDAEEVAQGLKEIYRQGRETMLRNVASRVAKGAHSSVWAQRKTNEVLAAHHALEVNLNHMAKERESLLSGVIDRAMVTGSQQFYTDMTHALGYLGVSPVSPNGIKSAYILADLNNSLNAAERRILRQFDDKYADVIGAVSAKMATGVITYRQAAGEALQHFADAGIDGFVDRGGHHWTLENYSEMAVLTAIERASLSGYVDTMQSYGYDLAVIDGHAGACPVCVAWEGVIVSVSGDDPDYPSLSEAEGEGVFHPRCAHGVVTYYPGITDDYFNIKNKPDPIEPPSEEYTARSRQRYMERQIRKYKDRGIVAQTEQQKQEAANKVREWSGALDDLIKASSAAGYYMYRHRNREVDSISRQYTDVTDSYLSTASPGEGMVTYDSDFDFGKRTQNERDMAEWIYKTFGGDIKLLSESKEDGVRMPDYLWRKAYWELKSPTTSKAAKSAARHALTQIARQPGGIILNYGNNSFDMEQVLKNVDSQAHRTGLSFEFDLMILQNGNLVKAYHHK